ncbi:polymorphic toxin type 15 domain-containing protein [Actinomyces lilanjuaniae]|uniref:polymorphic toxin type 15 domain-containing protein n=1 Tax=Actinomyces lilanjuaniae TaxID=2321394 RepID=UPI0013C4B0CA|nr:polymorphic toxin type 15 domain-containing protein [Actinomyces lilanjuaniae]
MAAPDSPLAWHSATPVEVFFHTGHQPATQELASEFTRQLDRQLSALSLLSVERLLEGIRTYRAQGRQPTSKATRNRRKEFMKEVVGDLRDVHQFSREDARAATRDVDRALVVLHESDQLLAGPGGPATTAEGWPSLGHGAVNSSIGGQQPPVSAVLEQAALQVPPQQRARVRLLVRAVLADSPDLAQDLRHGQTVLEPRTQAQVSATSPRGPPWTPAHVAATLAAGHPPWHPPPAQEQGHGQTRQDTRGQQPGQDQPGAPTGADPARTTSLREASFPHPPTAAVRVPPPQTGQPPQTDRPGQPSRPLTREEVLARITARVQQPSQPRTTRQPRAAREAPAGTGPARTASLREASFPHPPTTAARTPPAQAQPQTGPATGQPSRAGRPGHKITPRRSWPTSRPEPPRGPSSPPPHARPPPETADATEA